MGRAFAVTPWYGRATVDSPARERPRPRPFEYVLLVFGLALVYRYAWVMDDAFIYARYADNAALMRLGLVFNAGEYVEGFTSPLWMLWILLWRALGLGLWTIWLGSGLAAYSLSWWLLIRVDRALSSTTMGINVPLSFLALSYPVCAWFSSGMETGLVQLCAVGTALFLVAPKARAGQLLLGLAPLARPELALPFLICVGYEWWSSGRAPKLALALGVGTNLGWLLFRVIYYADLLPNTFYLKHGNSPRQGLHYLVNALHSYGLEFLVLATIALLAWARRTKAEPAARSRARVMMWVASIPVLAYVVRIGGDAQHYRYLAYPFCLSVCACAGLPETWVSAWVSARVSARSPASGNAGRPPSSLARYGTLASAAIAALSFALQPPQREVHAIVRPGDPHKVHEISDPGRHRRQPHLVEAARVDPKRAYKLAVGRDPEAFEYVASRGLSWCAKAYFEPDLRVTHLYGLTDPFLARMNVPPDPEDRPGHTINLAKRAVEINRIHVKSPDHGPGMMRASIEGRYGARWVEQNLERVELIERKVYNHHDLVENLGLALRPVGRIVTE